MGQLLERLSERHDVGLLYFRRKGEDPLPEKLRDRCRFAIEVRHAGGRDGIRRLGRNLRLAASPLLGRLPMWAADWLNREFAERAKQIAAEWKPDIIQAESHVMGQYLERKMIGPRTILVEHEPGAAAAADRCRMYNGLPGFLYQRDLMMWKQFEKTVLGNADAVVAFTARDAAVLRELAPATRIEVLPIGTVSPQQPPGTASSVELLFVGNYIHPPNVDAALRLGKNIFPQVQREIPEARLVLAGANPPPSLRDLEGQHVTVPGLVPDLAPVLRRAAVVAVPLRYGGGIRVKVLEALAAGKAVVASRLAVEGVPVLDGEHVLIAETDAEFASAIRSLLGDPVRRSRIAANAREWAVANLGWERIVAGHEALYESLLNPGPSGS